MGKTINEDKKISIAIMSSFAILTIQYLILVFFRLMGTNIGHMVQLTSKALVALFYLWALPIVLKRNKIKFIGIYSFAVFIFILNYAMFYENRIYLKPIIFPLFFICLPSFIYAYSIEDWDILMKVIKKVSNIVFIIGTILGLLVFAGNVSVGSYSMSLSYYMLLPSVVYLDDFMDRFSLKKGLALLTLLIIILGLGSRGPVLCIAVFGILKILKSLKKMTLKRVLIYFIVFSLVIICFIFFDKIISFMFSLLSHFGVNSRSLKLFLRNSIHLSGRDRIYNKVISETLKQPILGLGLAGDRVIIGGGYAHNIFLEIMSHFGIVIGTFIIFSLLWLIFKSLKQKSELRYNIIIIWVSIGFIPLLVSSSYLINMNFWVMLGLICGNFKILKMSL